MRTIQATINPDIPGRTKKDRKRAAWNLELRAAMEEAMSRPVRLKLGDLEKLEVMRTVIQYMCHEVWRYAKSDCCGFTRKIPFDYAVQRIVQLMEPFPDDYELELRVMTSIGRLAGADLIDIGGENIILR